MYALQIAVVEAELLNLASWLFQCIKDASEAFITDLAFLQGKFLQWRAKNDIAKKLLGTSLIEDSVLESKLSQSSEHAE